MVNDALKGRRHLICIIIGVSLRSGLVIDLLLGWYAIARSPISWFAR